MKSIMNTGEEYDLDVQGALVILEYAASEHCQYLYRHETTPFYTQKEILDSIALLKKEVA